MKQLTLLTLLILAAPFGWGDSQSANEKQVDVSAYSPPVPTKKINPQYPARARAQCERQPRLPNRTAGICCVAWGRKTAP